MEPGVEDDKKDSERDDVGVSGGTTRTSSGPHTCTHVRMLTCSYGDSRKTNIKFRNEFIVKEPLHV